MEKHLRSNIIIIECFPIRGKTSNLFPWLLGNLKHVLSTVSAYLR